MSTPIERALQREKIMEQLVEFAVPCTSGQIVERLAVNGVTMPKWLVNRRLLELLRDYRVNRYRKWSTYMWYVNQIRKVR